MRYLRLRAHAKLNLALRVGSPRSDGYHPIAGVFQTINLCDLLYARREARGADRLLRLKVSGASLPADNTVSAAVDKLAAEARRRGIEPEPLSMTLIKRVPIGAGLGGGSSDAVAALAACVRLWKLESAGIESSGALARIAEELGSDVPFFLLGGTAMVSGRGESVEPLDPLKSTWFVIAAPETGVSTAAAYAEFDRFAGRDPASRSGAPTLPPYEPVLSEDWMGNDLQAPVSAWRPDIARVGRRLAELGGRMVHMTGSGAASFAAFADRRSAARASRVLRAEKLWAAAAVSISRRAHRRAGLGGLSRQGGEEFDA